MLDSRPRGHGFEPHGRHCVVSLNKNINLSLVLVQPRKTCPFITERLLMGCKESNQTNQISRYSKCPKILNTFLSLFVKETLIIRAWIYIMHVRLASWKDPDQAV